MINNGSYCYFYQPYSLPFAREFLLTSQNGRLAKLAYVRKHAVAEKSVVAVIWQVNKS